MNLSLNDLLSLNKIGDIAFVVDPSALVSKPGTISASPRNHGELDRNSFSLFWLDLLISSLVFL